jgi:hypothetical protein
VILSPWCVRVAPSGDGVRVVARDWPWAPAFAAACGAPGLALLAWSVAEGHAVEAGGAAVLCGFGAFGAWLAAARRRDLVVAAGPGGVGVRGVEGAGPFSRTVERTFPAAAEAVLEPFPVPPGAPDLPDRGGDLVLRAGETRVLLARAAGPRWRERLAVPAEAVGRALSRS